MVAETPRARAVCVTGMHRSGTSLVARALDLLGVSLGDPNSLMEPGPDNAAGYWENRSIKELDDVLLAALGGTWDRPPVLEPLWERDESLEALRDRARSILRSDFPDDGHELIGWKDPRLSLLLPFWRTVADVQTSIVVVRNPIEVAASLSKRNGLRESDAALLWLRYLLAARANDESHLLLLQEDVVRDAPTALASIASHLGLAPPDHGAEEMMSRHLDPGLVHHSSSEPEDPDNPLVQLALRVWSGGSIDMQALPPEIAQGLATGWLRSPSDDSALTAARAQAVTLKERLRRRGRKVANLKSQLEELQRDRSAAKESGEPTP